MIISLKKVPVWQTYKPLYFYSKTNYKQLFSLLLDFKSVFYRIETPSFPQEPAFHGERSPTPLFPLELHEELLSF